MRQPWKEEEARLVIAVVFMGGHGAHFVKRGRVGQATFQCVHTALLPRHGDETLANGVRAQASPTTLRPQLSAKTPERRRGRKCDGKWTEWCLRELVLFRSRSPVFELSAKSPETCDRLRSCFATDARAQALQWTKHAATLATGPTTNCETLWRTQLRTTKRGAHDHGRTRQTRTLPGAGSRATRLQAHSALHQQGSDVKTASGKHGLARRDRGDKGVRGTGRNSSGVQCTVRALGVTGSQRHL
ncbi:hypothetical protein ERJ75_001165300 [Trypanosoma vivax]|nr:hypothetical protein TRVL_02000 [Trypanosoma vivax]KAH8609818.1 hypothetical protein ERJ75_001165300 [Trypanosoma vivax]